MYYTSIDYISAKTHCSALMKAYLWSTNDGDASWNVDGLQGPQQDTKPASGKIANCSYSYSSFYSRKTFVQQQLICGCRCCPINNAN